MAKKKTPPPATRTQAAKKPLRKGLIQKPAKRKKKETPAEPKAKKEDKRKPKKKQPAFASYQHPKPKKKAAAKKRAKVKANSSKSAKGVAKKTAIVVPVDSTLTVDLPDIPEDAEVGAYSRVLGTPDELPELKLAPGSSRLSIEGFVNTVTEAMVSLPGFTMDRIRQFAEECSNVVNTAQAKAVAERYVTLV